MQGLKPGDIISADLVVGENIGHLEKIVVLVKAVPSAGSGGNAGEIVIPMKIVQETDNLFRLTRLGMVNCFLVRESDGLTLVDACLPGTASAILGAARENRGPDSQRFC